MAYLIGIAGGSASGKTSFIQQLQSLFGANEITVLSQDHYYKPIEDQIRDENGKINFDLPESIDLERFLRDLNTLENGQDLSILEYTFNNPDKAPESITIKANPIIVVEGLFIFENRAISERLNLKLFIEANEEIKYSRRLYRDLNERGIPVSDIEYQWFQHVKPSFEKYLLPHRETVDMVIVNNTHFNHSLMVVKNHIQAILNKL